LGDAPKRLRELTFTPAGGHHCALQASIGAGLVISGLFLLIDEEIEFETVFALGV